MWKKATEFLKKDKDIAPLIVKYGPCRIKKSRVEKYFYDLASAIVSQQLSGRVAEVIFERLVKGVGSGREDLSPTAILNSPDETLRSYGLSWAKIKYLKDLSTNTERGVLDLNNLNKLSDEEIIQKLLVVKGIGRWTAEMFLMFSLGRPDVFPVDDLGIRRGLEKLYGREFLTEDIAKAGLKWKPYRTAAAWYIWQSLNG